MKYAFVYPGYLLNLYYCEHEGQGFTVSTRLEDALVLDDPKNAATMARVIRQQSQRPVRIEKVSWIAGRG